MKKLLALILAAVMILGLSACSNEPKPTEPATQPQSTAPSETSKESTSAPTESQTAPDITQAPTNSTEPQEDRHGGEFAFNYSNGMSEVLDGCQKTGNTVYCWSFYTFENPLAKDGSGNICPKVCNFEYDPATATLKLWPRENVHFSNGDVVDVEDVFASVDRAMHLVKQMKTDMLQKLVKDPEIITDTDGIRKAVYVFESDSSTNLQRLHAYQRWCPVMPKEIIEKYGYDGTIVDPADCIATGPYKVVEFEPGISCTLVPNEYYVPDENGLTGLAGPVYANFDKVIVYGNIDEATEAMMMASGQIDYSSNVGMDYYETILKPLGFEKQGLLNSYTQIMIVFNMMNKKMPVAEDANLRKAIIAALSAEDIYSLMQRTGDICLIDTEIMISEAYSTKRLAEADYYAGGASNTEIAKAYLAKSNFDTSKPLKLLLHEGTPRNYDLVFQENLAKIGITVEFVSVPGATQVDDYYAYAADYDYDFTWVTPSGALYNPGNLVQNVKTRFWANERKDELFTVFATTELGSAESLAAWEELLDLWIDDCAVFPIIRHFQTAITNPDLVLGTIDDSLNRINSYWKANKEDHTH